MFEEVITSYSSKLKQILNQPVFRFATVTSRRVPKDSGVYLIHDDSLKQISARLHEKTARAPTIPVIKVPTCPIERV